MSVEQESETDIRKKALIVIEYLASQEKPDVKMIYKAAHVAGVCHNPHEEWREQLDRMYEKVTKKKKVKE